MRRASPLVLVALVLSCGDSAAPTTSGQDGGGRGADDASVEASGGDGGMQDQRRGTRTPGARQHRAAAGPPCNRRDSPAAARAARTRACSATSSSAPGGVWADREVFPAACNDGGSEGGPDGGRTPGPKPAAGRAPSPSDCGTFSDYCGGCSCEALGTGEPTPTCDGGSISCLVDPCQGHTATCSATHRCAIQ